MRLHPTPRTLMLLQVPLGVDSCEVPACKRARLAMGEQEVDLDMASMCLPLLGRSWCASSPDTVARAVAAEVGVLWCGAPYSVLWYAEISGALSSLHAGLWLQRWQSFVVLLCFVLPGAWTPSCSTAAGTQLIACRPCREEAAQGILMCAKPGWVLGLLKGNRL